MSFVFWIVVERLRILTEHRPKMGIRPFSVLLEDGGGKEVNVKINSIKSVLLKDVPSSKFTSVDKCNHK